MRERLARVKVSSSLTKRYQRPGRRAARAARSSSVSFSRGDTAQHRLPGMSRAYMTRATQARCDLPARRPPWKSTEYTGPKSRQMASAGSSRSAGSSVSWSGLAGFSAPAAGPCTSANLLFSLRFMSFCRALRPPCCRDPFGLLPGFDLEPARDRFRFCCVAMPHRLDPRSVWWVSPLVETRLTPCRWRAAVLVRLDNNRPIASLRTLGLDNPAVA